VKRTEGKHKQGNALCVAAYLRVSTDEQARSGLGLEAQRAQIIAEAKRRNWTVTWFIDEAASAKNLNRPALTDCLAGMRDGTHQALVVAKLDRLSRSLVDFASLLEHARKQDWALIALDLGVDTTTPAGELVANVMAAVAQWERRVIGQRTSDALRARQAMGLPVGRPRAVTSDCLDQLVALRESGMPYAAIAKHMNDNGTPTATGKGSWTGYTVARMLTAHNENNQEEVA
jgi:DNA invertase Pin-like site-specific DNA recombinase